MNMGWIGTGPVPLQNMKMLQSSGMRWYSLRKPNSWVRRQARWSLERLEMGIGIGRDTNRVPDFSKDLIKAMLNVG